MEDVDLLSEESKLVRPEVVSSREVTWWPSLPNGQQLLSLVMALLPICRAASPTLTLPQKCSEAGLRFPDWKSSLDRAWR